MIVRTLGIASILSLAMALGAVAQPAPQQPATPRNQCFFSNDFQSWKAADDRTLFIRAGANRYYRLDLANACPAATYPSTRMISRVRGPNTICSPLDWDIQFSQGDPGIPTPCIVKTMTQLTPAQVAAIPPRAKP